MNRTDVSRRDLLAAGGALVVSFSLGRVAAAAEQGGTPPPAEPRLPGSLQQAPSLDSWIRVDGSGAITVFTGKVELGQGVRTALLQVAA